MTRCTPHLTHGCFNKGVLVTEKAHLVFSGEKRNEQWAETHAYFESKFN